MTELYMSNFDPGLSATFSARLGVSSHEPLIEALQTRSRRRASLRASATPGIENAG